MISNHLATHYIITGECDKEGDDVTKIFLITCIVIACIITCIITAVVAYRITCLCYKCSSKRRHPPSKGKNPPKGGVAVKTNGVSTHPEALTAGSGKLDCGSISLSIVNSHT